MPVPEDRDAETLIRESEPVRLKASQQPEPAEHVSQQPATLSAPSKTGSDTTNEKRSIAPVKFWPVIVLAIGAAVGLLWDAPPHAKTPKSVYTLPVLMDKAYRGGSPDSDIDSTMRFATALVKHNRIDATLTSSKIAGPLSRLDQDALATGLFSSIQSGIDDLNGPRKKPMTRDDVNRLMSRLSKGPKDMKRTFKTAETSLKAMGPDIIPDLEAYAKEIIPESADPTDATLTAWKKEICLRVLSSFGQKGTDSLIRILQVYSDPSVKQNMNMQNRDVFDETVHSLLDSHYAFARLSDLAMSSNAEERAKALESMDLLIVYAGARNVMLPRTLEPVLTGELANSIEQARDHQTPMGRFNPFFGPLERAIRELSCVEFVGPSSIKQLIRVIYEPEDIFQGGLDRESERALALILKRTEGTPQQLPSATRSQVIEAIKKCESKYISHTRFHDMPEDTANVAALVQTALGPAPLPDYSYARPKMLTTVAFNDGYTVRELLGPVQPAGQ